MIESEVTIIDGGSKRLCEKRVYKSVKELTEVALSQDAGHRRKLTKGGYADAYVGSDPYWIGRSFKNLDDVCVKVNSAWDDGLAIVTGMIDELGSQTLPAPKCRRRVTRFSDVDGAELDYDRLRAGQDWWRTTHRANASGPTTLTIAVDVGGNAARGTEEVLWRGAAAVVLTQLLEKQGYRVSLWLYQSSSNCYTDGAATFNAACLKDFSATLDRSTVVNAVSGWFLRTVMFAVRYVPKKRTPRGSLGSHRRVSAAEIVEFTHDPATVVVDNLWTRRAAVDFIRATLSKFK